MDTLPAKLVAPLTPWFTRRMTIMIGLLAFFTAYFGYDWKIGYPRKALVYQEYLAHQQRGEEGLREWATLAQEKGYKLEDEKTLMPMKVDDGKIAQQFYCMILCGLITLAITAHAVRAVGTTLAADADALHLPHIAAPIPYSAITRVDTRKWLNKGLASIWYRSGDKVTKGVIDGLKYGGFKGDKPYLPDQILERVVANLQGELIELTEESPAESSQPTV